MKKFWKVFGLVALVSSIPFKAEKDEQGELKNMTALLWKYDKVPSDVYVDEVHHEVSLGLNLPDFKKVKEKVTDTFSKVKETVLPVVEVDIYKEEDAADEEAPQQAAQEEAAQPEEASTDGDAE